MGGPDLLKWGVPGGGIKSAKVAPTPYVYYPPPVTAALPGWPHSLARVMRADCAHSTLNTFDFAWPIKHINSNQIQTQTKLL